MTFYEFCDEVQFISLSKGIPYFIHKTYVLSNTGNLVTVAYALNEHLIDPTLVSHYDIASLDADCDYKWSDLFGTIEIDTDGWFGKQNPNKTSGAAPNTVVKTSQCSGSQHVWKQYQGLMESYEYCGVCGVKK